MFLRTGLLRWITTLLVCSLVGLQRSAFLRWITCFFVRSLVDYRRQLLFRSSSVSRRSSVKDFTCESASTVAIVECRRQPSVGSRRRLLAATIDVRRILSVATLDIPKNRFRLSPLDYIAHRCVAVCNLHHSRL